VALAPTLYDFDVTLSQVDAGVDARFSVKAARHPSESLDRLWLRLLAYCWRWQEGIAFGPGLSDPDAPDVVARDLTGEETLWMRVGKPAPERIQREADRHPRARVAVLFESAERLEAFAAAARAEGIARLARVELAAVDSRLLAALATEDERRVRVAVTIVGDHLYLDRAGRTVDGPLHRLSLEGSR
jgi:uncharacterized protein YaeQ